MLIPAVTWGRYPRGVDMDRRTYHLLDVENLACGCGAYSHARADYEAAVGVGPNDVIVVGCDISQLFAVHDVFPTCRLHPGRGPDGADLALIDAVVLDLDRMAEQFDRLVIGSGDHIFATVAHRARAAGLVVEAAARELTMSADLYLAVDRFRSLPSLPSPLPDGEGNGGPALAA